MRTPTQSSVPPVFWVRLSSVESSNATLASWALALEVSRLPAVIAGTLSTSAAPSATPATTAAVPTTSAAAATPVTTPVKGPQLHRSRTLLLPSRCVRLHRARSAHLPLPGEHPVSVLCGLSEALGIVHQDPLTHLGLETTDKLVQCLLATNVRTGQKGLAEGRSVPRHGTRLDTLSQHVPSTSGMIYRPEMALYGCHEVNPTQRRQI